MPSAVRQSSPADRPEAAEQALAEDVQGSFRLNPRQRRQVQRCLPARDESAQRGLAQFHGGGDRRSDSPPLRLINVSKLGFRC
jgi:hypothetical protein